MIMKVIFPKAGRAEENNSFENKRQRIPKGQSKKDNQDKLATQAEEKTKQKDNTICVQTPLYANKHKRRK